MVMRMLAAGGLPPFADESRSTDPDNPFGYFEHSAVRRIRQDASWMRLATGRAVKVVVPLVQHLPCGFDYVVLLVERDLTEVLASQEAMLRRMGRPVGEASVLIDAYARQVAVTRQALRDRGDVASLKVEFRRVLADPHGAAREIAEHVGLGLDVVAMAAAVAPQLPRHLSTGARPVEPVS